jgi:hypothetical protein
LEYHHLERLAKACLQKIKVRVNFEPYYLDVVDGDRYEMIEYPPVWRIGSVDVTLPEEISSFFSNLGGNTYTLGGLQFTDTTMEVMHFLPYLDNSFVADTSRLNFDARGTSVLYEGNLGKATLTRDGFLGFQFPNRNEVLSIQLIARISSDGYSLPTPYGINIRFETNRDSSYRCPR